MAPPESKVSIVREELLELISLAQRAEAPSGQPKKSDCVRELQGCIVNQHLAEGDSSGNCAVRREPSILTATHRARNWAQPWGPGAQWDLPVDQTAGPRPRPRPG